MNKENKKLCSQGNPCQECQKRQQELLAKTEDWEIKKKEKLEKFEFIESQFCHNKNPDGLDKIRYSGDYTYNSNFERCSSCQAVIKIIKLNSYGDKAEELKEHNSNCQTSNQIKSNQIKSNQIKSNQIQSRMIRKNLIYRGF